jgi:glycerol-3-phosphate acyltransferase PlsY
MGVDVRRAGSGNIGATNVARTVGASAGLITLLVDVAKGALPLLVAVATGASSATLSLAAFSAVLGHVFSVFTRLRGGKGVATAAGAFLILSPGALAVALIVFGLVAAVWRRVSLASISACTALPLALLVLAEPGAEIAAGVATAVLVLFTHRENIRRLVAGTEPRFEPRRP